MNKEYISITEINRIIKNTIELNPVLKSVYIKGEISNLKFHGRGHLYFSLKDENSKINAVMFNYKNSGIDFEPPPRPNIIVSISSNVFASSIIETIFVAALCPCTSVGNKYISVIGNLLLIVDIISLTAAPVGAVMTPIFLGTLLILCLCSGLNNPSSPSFFFSFSKRTYKFPRPSNSSESTYIW